MGADMSGKQSYEADFTLPLVLVLRNEGGGLSGDPGKMRLLLHIPCGRQFPH